MRAVRDGAATEVVPLHGALEALADRSALHVDVLADLENRIRSMALVHELLVHVQEILGADRPRPVDRALRLHERLPRG